MYTFYVRLLKLLITRLNKVRDKAWDKMVAHEMKVDHHRKQAKELLDHTNKIQVLKSGLKDAVNGL